MDIKIAFLTEGNKVIGMGHYTRCLGIAGSLIQNDSDVVFYIPSDADADFVISCGMHLVSLKGTPNRAYDTDEICGLIKKDGLSVLVIDSYRVGVDAIRALKTVCRVLYIDDMDMYDCPSDIVINFNPEARLSDYEKHHIPGRKVYVGTRYYPLRNDFSGKRRSDISEKVKKVMITTGSTDPYSCAEQIICALSPADFPDIDFFILCGLYYEKKYTDRLKALFADQENVSFISWSKDVASLTGGVDMVITPGSSMLSEALSLNIPCISYQFEDNHYLSCKSLDEAGAADFIGRLPDKSLDSKIRELFLRNLDHKERISKSGVYSELFDGDGLERITRIILEKPEMDK